MNIENILSIVNQINTNYSGTKVGSVCGHRDQWLLGCYYNNNSINFNFCQGRNIGRITQHRGFQVDVNLKNIGTIEELKEEIYKLDYQYPKRRLNII